MTDADKMNASIGALGGHAGGAWDGIDMFEGPQEPHLPKTDDPLARFVIARIIEAELEPRGEVAAVYDKVGGPMAHRYAKHMREDCVVFRKIVALYLMEPAPLRGVVEAIAQRWAGHADFDENWM